MGIWEHGGEGMIHLQNVQRGQEGQGLRGSETHWPLQTAHIIGRSTGSMGTLDRPRGAGGMQACYLFSTKDAQNQDLGREPAQGPLGASW